MIGVIKGDTRSLDYSSYDVISLWGFADGMEVGSHGCLGSWNFQPNTEGPCTQSLGTWVLGNSNYNTVVYITPNITQI